MNVLFECFGYSCLLYYWVLLLYSYWESEPYCEAEPPECSTISLHLRLSSGGARLWRFPLLLMAVGIRLHQVVSRTEMVLMECCFTESFYQNKCFYQTGASCMVVLS